MERGRLQDAGDGQGDRLVDRAGREIVPPERREPFPLVAGERTAPRPLGEPLDAGPCAVLLRGGGQGGPVGAVEERRRQRSERREVHRREVQLLDLVGRRVLPLRDPLEAASAWLRRKTPRPDRRRWGRQEDSLACRAPRAQRIGHGRPSRPALAVPRKPEQVGDGVVVLGRRQRQGRRARGADGSGRLNCPVLGEAGRAKQNRERECCGGGLHRGLLTGTLSRRTATRDKRTCNRCCWKTPEVGGRLVVVSGNLGASLRSATIPRVAGRGGTPVRASTAVGRSSRIRSRLRAAGRRSGGGRRACRREGRESLPDRRRPLR